MAKVKPTKLQKATVEILKDNPKMPVGKAMRKAGYKSSTSVNPGRDFLELKGTQVAMEQWREALRGSGLGEKKLIKKYEEWIDAQKVVSSRITGKDADSMTDDFIEVPDYQTQIKVGEMLREDFGLKGGDTNVAVQVNFNEAIKKQKDEYGI